MSAAGDTNEIDHARALRRQADKLSTYSIAIRNGGYDAACLRDVAQLLGVAAEAEAIASRLIAFENICHLLNHIQASSLRPKERQAFHDYTAIAVELDDFMQQFATELKYEEGRQNSRNWIEEHQSRPSFSPYLAQIAQRMEEEVAAEENSSQMAG